MGLFIAKMIDIVIKEDKFVIIYNLLFNVLSKFVLYAYQDVTLE